MTAAEYQEAKNRQDRSLTLLEMIETGSITVQLPTLAYPRLRPRYVCSAETEDGRGFVRLCYGSPSPSAGWISLEGCWGEPTSSVPGKLVDGFCELELRTIDDAGAVDDYWVDHDPESGSHDAVMVRLLASEHSWPRIALAPDPKLFDYRWLECPLHRRSNDGRPEHSIALL